MNVRLLESADFRKASGSGDIGCVEVAFVPGGAGVRDSKDQAGPVLAFSAKGWNRFLGDVRAVR